MPTGPCQDTLCSLAVDENGDIYVPVVGVLVALSPSGRFRWLTREINSSTVALGSVDRVFGAVSVFPTCPRAIVPIDKASGAAVWKTPLENFIVATLVLDENRSTVYATGTGGIIALNSNTGIERWRISVERCDRVGMGLGGEQYAVCRAGPGLFLYAVNPDGVTRWTRPLSLQDGAFLSPVIDRMGTVIVIANKGITAYTSSGDLAWTYSVNPNAGLIALSDPVVDADRNLYFVEKLNLVNAPAITVFRDGQRVGKVADVSDPHGRALLLSRDGRVFYDANRRIVYFESRGYDPLSPWPMNRGTPGRTARR